MAATDSIVGCDLNIVKLNNDRGSQPGVVCAVSTCDDQELYAAQ